VVCRFVKKLKQQCALLHPNGTLTAIMMLFIFPSDAICFSLSIVSSLPTISSSCARLGKFA